MGALEASDGGANLLCSKVLVSELSAAEMFISQHAVVSVIAMTKGSGEHQADQALCSCLYCAFGQLMRHSLARSSGLISVRHSPKASNLTRYSCCAVRAEARDQGSMALDIDREMEFTSKARTVY